MPTMRQYMTVFAVMKNMGSMLNILDGISWRMKGIDPSSGNPSDESWDVSKIQDDAIAACDNIVAYQTMLNSFIAKKGQSNVADVLNSMNINAANAKQEFDAIADEAIYILSNVLLAEDMNDLEVLGDHIQSNITPLDTPLNHWRL